MTAAPSQTPPAGSTRTPRPGPRSVPQAAAPAPLPDVPTRMDIDPVTAAAWMQRNTRNRHVREDQVDAFARDMATGAWQYTAEPIKFSAAGDLLDGQHRLMAILRSKATIQALVVPGLDEGAQEVMDTGAKRTAADALGLAGEVETTLLASTARLGVLVERDFLGTNGKQVTHSEINAWIAGHPEIRKAVTGARNLKAIPLPGTVVAFALWRLRQVDADDANAFFTDLAQMRTDGAGDPRAALLQRLNSARSARERLNRQAQLSLLFRTWNAVRRGQSLHKIPVTYRNGAVEVPVPV